MAPSEQELQALGRTTAKTFKKLIEAPWTNDQDTVVPSKRRIAAEDERFRLWARTLGLFQTGHASLDYRLRDASFVKASLRELLLELQDHLNHLMAIALGSRLPLERDEKTPEASSETGSSDDEMSLESSIGSSVGSFCEAEYRLSSVATRLDSLYKLVSRIRSPRNRQQRPIKDLCKHIPEDQRDDYIQTLENIEVSLAAYIQRQQLTESINDEQLQELGCTQDELLAEYASENHWLIQRVGKANARRKQHFLYWKKHSQILAHETPEEAPAVTAIPVEAASRPTANQKADLKPAAVGSMTTSVTNANLNVIGPGDTRSDISRCSRISTVISPRGEELFWPPPPTHLIKSNYFHCPYCTILCPERYLGQNDWRIHQIHDLQPYQCTYEDCPDPGRLYGTKQDWIDHENQHRRVWHCHGHETEFETQPEYLHHLKEQHPESEVKEYTPEMIATATAASTKPHRDCPFCPTVFSDVPTMQRHVRYHLERLALYALPDTQDDGEDDPLAPERSSDSRQVLENLGRQDSIANDFQEEPHAFRLEPIKETRFPFSDESDFHFITPDQETLDREGTELTKGNLKRLSSAETWVDSTKWISQLPSHWTSFESSGRSKINTADTTNTANTTTLDTQSNRQKAETTPSAAVANLTEAQRAELEDVFKIFDRNVDGTISPHELQIAMNSLGLRPTLAEVMDIIKDIDTDGDGVINRAEFLEIMATPDAPLGDSQADLIAAFSVFDQDGNGFISASELLAVLVSLGHSVTDDEIEEMIKIVDLDGNGMIDYHEFVQLMRGGIDQVPQPVEAKGT